MHASLEKQIPGKHQKITNMTNVIVICKFKTAQKR